MSTAVRAAEDLFETIRQRAPDTEDARRLPADLAAKLAQAGLFRMTIPQVYGGAEVSAAEFSKAIETLATADAAVGWCVMIGVTSSLNAAYMPESAAREIFQDPNVITGGVFAPIGRAEIEGDHFRASGRWPWASGSANCDWLGGGCVVFEDGKPKMRSDGRPDTRMLMFRREDVELIDTWHSSGLRGTGSGDMAVDGARVPLDRAASLTDRPVIDRPLYAFPVFGLLAVGVASVALGNARAALDALKSLATKKKPQYSRRSIAERGTAQTDFARAEGRWRAARAFMTEAIDGCWRTATSGEPLTVSQRSNLRLACTHATRECAEIATTAYELGGGTSVYAKHPLQRHFRDAHVATQHIMVAPTTYELIGRVEFGLDTDTAML